jgi:Tfp pilus assembly protein PilE
MRHIHARRGFTRRDLIAVLVVLAVVVGLLISAIPNYQERARRSNCTNNMKGIGQGMQSYYDAHKCFPPSADLRGEGKIKTAGGWSFLFKILPNMDYDTIYSSVDPMDLNSSTIDPLTDCGVSETSKQSAHFGYAIAIDRDTGIGEFLCPSNPNPGKENIGAPVCTPPRGLGHAVTNYKALGATSIESLLVSLDPDSPPPYGDKSRHPGGVLFPVEKGIKIDEIKDGLANTVMITETMDYKASTWIAGSDVNLVGMDKGPGYFQYQSQNAIYWAPAGFNGKFYSQAASAVQSMRTYLAYDFHTECVFERKSAYEKPSKLISVKKGKDVGTYPSGVGRTPDYGPSSNHLGVVNHLFCDGSVHSLRKDIDYAAYFFAITRDNGDPGVVPGNE